MLRVSCAFVLLFLGGGCALPPAGSSDGGTEAGVFDIDADLLKIWGQMVFDYAEALDLLNSVNPKDWDEAFRRLDVLTPFRLDSEDPDLIRRAREGQGEAKLARRELGRRGRILKGLFVFVNGEWGKWDAARKELVALGEDAQARLTDVLLGMLLNGLMSEHWDLIRYQLVKIGPEALGMTVTLVQRLVDDVPVTPIFKGDDLVQTMQVLLGFGAAAREKIVRHAASSKKNVRRCLMNAIAGNRDDAYVGLALECFEQDGEWEVRGAAAQALGQMAAVKEKAGADLLKGLHREKDPYVLMRIVEALGELRHEAARMDLIHVLDYPRMAIREAAMVSLGKITGQRFTTPGEWKKWWDQRNR